MAVQVSTPLPTRGQLKEGFSDPKFNGTLVSTPLPTRGQLKGEPTQSFHLRRRSVSTPLPTRGQLKDFNLAQLEAAAKFQRLSQLEAS